MCFLRAVKTEILLFVRKIKNLIAKIVVVFLFMILKLRSEGKFIAYVIALFFCLKSPESVLAANGPEIE